MNRDQDSDRNNEEVTTQPRSRPQGDRVDHEGDAESAKAKLRLELLKAFDESWKRNEEAYRYLGR